MRLAPPADANSVYSNTTKDTRAHYPRQLIRHYLSCRILCNRKYAIKTGKTKRCQEKLKRRNFSRRKISSVSRIVTRAVYCHFGGNHGLKLERSQAYSLQHSPAEPLPDPQSQFRRFLCCPQSWQSTDLQTRKSRTWNSPSAPSLPAHRGRRGKPSPTRSASRPGPYPRGRSGYGSVTRPVSV